MAMIKEKNLYLIVVLAIPFIFGCKPSSQNTDLMQKKGLAKQPTIKCTDHVPKWATLFPPPDQGCTRTCALQATATMMEQQLSAANKMPVVVSRSASAISILEGRVALLKEKVDAIRAKKLPEEEAQRELLALLNRHELGIVLPEHWLDSGAPVSFYHIPNLVDKNGAFDTKKAIKARESILRAEFNVLFEIDKLHDMRIAGASRAEVEGFFKRVESILEKMKLKQKRADDFLLADMTGKLTRKKAVPKEMENIKLMERDFWDFHKEFEKWDKGDETTSHISLQLKGVLDAGLPIFVTVTKGWEHAVDGALSVKKGADGADGAAAADAKKGKSKYHQQHAMSIVGYRENGGKYDFLLKNSWGEDWEEAGYKWYSSEFLKEHFGLFMALKVSDFQAEGDLLSADKLTKMAKKHHQKILSIKVGSALLFTSILAAPAAVIFTLDGGS